MKPFRSQADFRRMQDMEKPEKKKAREEFNLLISRIQKDSPQVTSVSLNKYDDWNLIRHYDNVFKELAKNTHIQTLETPVDEVNVLAQAFELTINPQLPLTSLTLGFKQEIALSKISFAQFLSEENFKLKHLKFNVLTNQFKSFDNKFVEDLFNALKTNTTIEVLDMPMTEHQQKMLADVLEKYNFTLKEIYTSQSLIPELQKLLKRNKQLATEVLDNCNNNSVENLSSTLQQFKIQHDPEVLGVFRNRFPELRTEFLKKNLFFDFWQTCKTNYLHDIDLSLLLAETFHAEKIVEDEELNQLIVFYFALNTQHLIYQEAIYKALKTKDPVPVDVTLKQYDQILTNCKKLIEWTPLVSLNFVDRNKVLLQKTKALVTKHPALFPELQSHEILEEKLAQSDYKGLLSHVSSQVDNNQNVSYFFEANLINTITRAMHQYELLRVLNDETLVLTKNYIDYLCSAFDKPIEKLQMLDEVAAAIAPNIHPYINQNPEQSSWKSWVPMWKSKPEIRDLRDPREKIEQLKIYYQNICKQNKNDPEIKNQAENSLLLKVQTSIQATDEEGQEMKEIHRPPKSRS